MKTIGVRIAIPEDLHTALKAAAEKDERKLAVFIVRLLKRARGLPIPDELQAASKSPSLPPVALDDLSAVTAAVTAVLAPQAEIPLAEWPDEQLVAELQSKRAQAQSTKKLISEMPAGPNAEQCKAELERTLQFVGVLEREYMKRRGKVPRKAPQPPRPNPTPQP